jgi:hypothetical protein
LSADGDDGSVPGGVVDDEDWTLAICIRCAQLYEAHLAHCPYCADLVVTVRNQATEGAPDADWSCQVRVVDGPAVLRLDHSPTAQDAHDKAHEFLRRYVAQRRRQQKP